MIRPLPPLAGVELQPASRLEWTRLVPRIRMPDRLMLLAGWVAAFADRDGSGLQLDLPQFAACIDADEQAVLGMLAVLCEEYGLLQVVTTEPVTHRLTLPADVYDRFEFVASAGDPGTGSVE